MNNNPQQSSTQDQTTKQLYLVIAVFVVIAACLVTLEHFQSLILDSARAYVAGEGYWSKGQKDAIYHLTRYASSHKESELQKFYAGIAVTLGDRKARLALQSNPPDIAAARDGLLQGLNNPKDVDNIIWLFRHFSNYGDMRKAIAVWKEGDKNIDELIAISNDVKNLVNNKNSTPQEMQKTLARLDRLNSRVSILENHFSAILGTAARKIKQTTNAIITTAAALLILFGVLISRKIIKSVRQTQDALIKSEARMRHVVESNIVGILFWDIDGTILDANDTFLDIIGYTRADLAAGKVNWKKLTPPESEQADANAIEEIRKSGFCNPYEKEFIHKDGHRISVYLAAAANESSIDSGSCFVIDISEKKRAEQALKLASTVFHSANEGIMVTDHQANIQMVNPSFTRITGYSSPEVIGQNPNMLGSELHDRYFFEAIWRKLEKTGKWQGEMWNRHKSGKPYQIRLSISAILDQDSKVSQYVGVFYDITEQRQLEERLNQSQKMEAIGTLVGGIAHDFNNTLTAIQGNLYLAQQFNRDNPKVATRLDNIQELSQHSAKIIKQLLMFSRKGHVEMVTISLNTMLTKIQNLTKSFIPENIQFEIHVCDQDLKVIADIAQLQQVMLNLYNNSVDAVANVAEPRIQTRLDSWTADDAFMQKYPWLNNNQLAHITINDNGDGMSGTTLEHIFEPFYTTKEVGKGTGLGMAMVYGAIQTHNGVIEIDTRENEGTTIHIYLELSGDGAHNTASPITFEGIINTHCRILLVDDFASLRNSYAEVLINIGYHVVTAENGVEALETFKREREDIDLVISDIVMPKTGGVQVLKDIRSLRPEIPVILMTGYDPNTDIPEDIRENTVVLSKPFSIQDLLAHIHRLTGKNSE